MACTMYFSRIYLSFCLYTQVKYCLTSKTYFEVRINSAAVVVVVVVWQYSGVFLFFK